MQVLNFILACGIVALFSGCVSRNTPGDALSEHSESPALSPGGEVMLSGSGSADDRKVSEVGMGPLSLNSLTDWVALALTRHAGLEAAYWNWQAAMEKAPQARAWADPKLTYGEFIRSVETRVGPQERRFGVAQQIPWKGANLTRADQAEWEARAAGYALDALRLKTALEVKSLYYEILYLERAIRVTQEAIQLVERLESVAQARLRSGGDVSVTLKAQVELSRLQNQHRTLESMKEPMRQKVRSLLNLPEQYPTPWPQAFQAQKVQDTSELEMESLRTDLSSHPELQRSRAMTEASAKGVTLARKAFLPDLTLGLDYIVTGHRSGVMGSDQGKDAVMAHGTAQLPLWLGKQRAALRQSRAQLELAVADFDATWNRLEVELAMARYQYQDATRKVDLYQQTLTPLAKSALEVAEQGYEAGRTSFLDWMDAQRALLDLQLSEARAVADREIALARLEWALGIEVELVPIGEAGFTQRR